MLTFFLDISLNISQNMRLWKEDVKNEKRHLFLNGMYGTFRVILTCQEFFSKQVSAIFLILKLSTLTSYKKSGKADEQFLRFCTANKQTNSIIHRSLSLEEINLVSKIFIACIIWFFWNLLSRIYHHNENVTEFGHTIIKQWCNNQSHGNEIFKIRYNTKMLFQDILI